MSGIELTAIASVFPERVVPNIELSLLTNRVADHIEQSPALLRDYDPEAVRANPEWIVKNTGVQQRYMMASGHEQSDDEAEKRSDSSDDKDFYNDGTRAAEKVLEKAGKTIDDVDLIIGATSSSPRSHPAIAGHIQKRLRGNNPPRSKVFDVQAGCTGFLTACYAAYNAMVAHPRIQTVMTITIEHLTRKIDLADRPYVGIFGDGASAQLWQRTNRKNHGILAFDAAPDEGDDASMLSEENRYGFRIKCLAGEPLDFEYGHFPFTTMSGRSVMGFANRSIESCFTSVIKEYNRDATTKLDAEDIAYHFMHTANIRIKDKGVRTLKKLFPRYRAETPFLISQFANTSAVSVPSNVEPYLQSLADQLIVMTAFGSGGTARSVLLRG